MRLTSCCAWGAVCVLALSACQRAESPPPVTASPDPVATAADGAAALFVPELMAYLVDPAAGVLLAAADAHAVPDVDDFEPRSAEAWQAVVDAAVQLAQTGRTLQQPALARGRADWLQWSLAISDSAAACGAAAGRHDAGALAAAGASLRAACQSCHARYAPGQVDPEAPRRPARPDAVGPVALSG